MNFNIGDKVRLKTYEEVAPLYPRSSRESYEGQSFYKDHAHDVFTVTSARNGLTFKEVDGNYNERVFIRVQEYEEPTESEIFSLFA